jgi:hypothetical protein
VKHGTIPDNPDTAPDGLDRDATDATEATEPAQDPEYYCPGCGRRWKFLTECRGQSAAAPHPPILVVDTAELDGDPADFTPAPASLGE